MRTLIVAVLFGLFSSFSPAVMAAPSQSSLCVITASKGEPVLNLCSKEEAELVVAASSKDAILSDIHSSLDFLIGMAYNDINFRCDNDYGHRKAPRSVITACFNKLDIQPKMTVLRVLKDLNALKECRDTETHPEAMACLKKYVGGNKDLFPILDKAYGDDAKYRKGLKFLKGKGCTIKRTKLVCAGLNGPIAFAFLILLALGRLFPRTRVLCGIVAMVIGMASCINQANAEKFECTSLETLVEASVKDPIGARMKFQASKAIASPFTDVLARPEASKKVKNTAVKAMKKLFCDSIGDDAETILAMMKVATDFFNRKELLEAIELRLESLKVQEGSCGGFLIVLLYGFLGFLGGCRSKSLVVLVALGCIVSTADAACTEAEIAANKVTAQYGFLRYDCDEDEVPQASKDAVFQVIWRGYIAKGGLKLGMSRSYIRSRWERAEGAFWAVWKDAPLWQAQVAVAICTKEYLCGVTVKFSEWDSFRWESPVNTNGTVDCGITQINSDSTSYSCDELQDLETAFQEQRRIIMLKVNNSNKQSVWKARIHRYNHSRNYQYGKTIWKWSGASFGWVALLMGLFGRRRKGQGDVGPIANGYRYPKATLSAWHQATPDEEPQDLQKRVFPIFTMDGWATAKIQKKLEGSLTENIEVSFILISDLTVVPQCVRIKEQPPMFPVLHIEDEFIFVAKEHKDDVLNPYVVEDYEFSLTQRQWGGDTLHFRATRWSNGDCTSKLIQPSTDWMNDDWEWGPQS